MDSTSTNNIISTSYSTYYIYVATGPYLPEIVLGSN